MYIKRIKGLLGILGVIAVVILVSFYIQRYRAVNQQLQSAPVENYRMGDQVSFEKNILINDTMEGYMVTVKKAEILSYKEFLKKYNAEDEYTYVPDKVYDVEIMLKNEQAEEGTGINLSEFYIQGSAVCENLEIDLCDAANPDLKGNDAIALRKNSEMILHLPFGLYRENFRADIWKNLQQFPMYLVVTLYPTKKIVSLFS